MPIHTSEKLTVYTDGGSRGNPGPAAVGVVIKNEKGDTLHAYGQFLGKRTNNEAEYEAVLFALKKIKALFGGAASSKFDIAFRLDSQLVCEQLSDRYKITEEHIGKLYLEVRNLKIGLGRVSFAHIPREQNHEADRLVNEALDAQEKQSSFAL